MHGNEKRLTAGSMLAKIAACSLLMALFGATVPVTALAKVLPYSRAFHAQQMKVTGGTLYVRVGGSVALSHVTIDGTEVLVAGPGRSSTRTAE